MKTQLTNLINFFGLMLLIIPSVQAQPFAEVLKQALATFEKAQTDAERVAASNRLELIANKYSDQWAPLYYAAYGKAMTGIMGTDNAKKDQYLDQADGFLKKAIALAPDNDENYVLAAMMASNRIGVDPQNRWQQYGQILEQNIQKAKDIWKDNPRLLYVQGLSLFFTPEQFGGGKKTAMSYFEKAGSLYEAETDTDIQKPSWGKQANLYFLSQCQKQ